MTKQKKTDNFQQAAEHFAQALQENFRAQASAQPEDQLKSPVQELIKQAGILSHRKVVTRTEAHAGRGIGRPDIAVLVDGLLCGYIELKAPGKGGNPDALKGEADKAQWKRFRSLPNIFYTDGTEWGLYQNGKRAADLFEFDGDVTKKGKRAIRETQGLQWLFELFLTWNPIVPKDPVELANVLAPLCHYLREDVLNALQNPKSNITELAREWREILFPDADDPKFADAYAQTLTYGLLLARFSGDEPLTMDNAPLRLDKAHGVLAQALRILGQTDVQNDIEVPLELLIRAINAVDREQFQRRREDPWLYFYEYFLAAYDPKLRRDYGVYYTPIEVIRAQVNLVAELLESEFDKPMNFADDGVVFLDPGAGTGAYPLAALHYGLRAVTNKYGEGMVAGRASKIAENMHAFETLVGPYAVAHMRLTQAILDYGGKLPSDGAHVYLSDTLESPNAKLPVTTPVFQKRLAEEHKRAQKVKAETRVLVCMGNPPYDRQQIERDDALTQRKGGWVRFGEAEKEKRDRPLLEDFLEPARQAGYGVHLKNLYNDYVYFWRWALWKVLEQTEAPGIVSFITASSYLRGPAFVGMREHMRRLFDELWIIDLEGDNLGARKTENVFAIQTPVAIAVGVRYGKAHPKKAAKVWYAKIEGTREEKLAQLAEVKRSTSLQWQACFTGWQEPLTPKSYGNYYQWPALTDLFPWQHSGVQFKRTWPIGETREVLLARWNRLITTDSSDRNQLMVATGSRHAGRVGANLVNGERLKPVFDEPKSAKSVAPVRYAYRSFNRSWILPDDRFCDRPRPPLWFAHGEKQVYITRAHLKNI
ncbi:DNA methyltransferase [candidate division KSB1 bacterium]|nr:MAG: DNA methyltransferase [candidate division KSB1 bacterium]